MTSASSEALLALQEIDPARWGWSVCGGIVDLLPPHERARRKEAKDEFLRRQANSASSFFSVGAGSPEAGRKSSAHTGQGPRLHKRQPQARPDEEEDAGGKSNLVLSDSEIAADGDETKHGDTQQGPLNSLTKMADSTNNSSSNKSLAGDGKLKNDSDPDENYGLSLKSYYPDLRVGLEPRNPRTGELIPNPSLTTQLDTNHRWDPSCLPIVKILVRIPLTDMDSDSDESINEESTSSHHGKIVKDRIKTRMHSSDGIAKKTEIVHLKSTKIGGEGASSKHRKMQEFYEQLIDWDITSPYTPTPSEFSIQMAEEYGLSAYQMIDLCESIQHQINHFRAGMGRYQEPIATVDSYGEPRQLDIVGTTLASRSSVAKLHYSPSARKGQKTARVGPKSMSGANKAADTGDKKLKKRSSTELRIRNVSDFQFTNNVQCRENVIERLKKESASEIIATGESLHVVTHHVCHICHLRKTPTIRFACGIMSHSFCEFHCQIRLSFSSEEVTAGSVDLKYCPICALECICPSCCRRLDKVCDETKVLSPSNAGSSPDSCLLRSARGASLPARMKIPRSPINIEKRSMPHDSTHLTRTRRLGACLTEKSDVGSNLVSKRRRLKEGKQFPPSHDEFPFECCQNRLMNDRDGEFKSKKWAAATKSKQDDENVDYCVICEKEGDIVCCDNCPRAFHRNCINENDPDRGNWLCPMCIRDAEIHADDYLTGSGSIELMSKMFSRHEGTENYCAYVSGIAKLHDMVVNLSGFDFGNIFGEPVDLEKFSDYLTVVSIPMDLGTIRKNLCLGEYDRVLGQSVDAKDETEEEKSIGRDLLGTQRDLKQKRPEAEYLSSTAPKSQKNRDSKFILKEFGDESQAHQSREALTHFDKIMLHILMDIERVWHNCFIYNSEKSAIYRMAEVQRRKYLVLKKCSIDGNLNDEVKKRLTEFNEANEKLRQSILKNGTTETSVIHIVQVPFCKGGTSRRIAVYDPLAQKVVRSYNSLRSAILAASYISNELGYAASIPLSVHQFKQMVTQSTTDAAVTLFGYRWLLESELNAGNVVL